MFFREASNGTPFIIQFAKVNGNTRQWIFQNLDIPWHLSDYHS